MAITNATRVADFGAGIGTQGAVLQVDNTNNRIGIGTTNPNQMLQVGTAVSVYGNSGIVSATSFYGDGSNITGVANTDFINATQLNVIGVTTVGAAARLAARPAARRAAAPTAPRPRLRLPPRVAWPTAGRAPA